MQDASNLPGNVSGDFSDGNPSTGVDGTKLLSVFMNDLMNNVLQVIVDAGTGMSDGDASDLVDAINQLCTDQIDAVDLDDIEDGSSYIRLSKAGITQLFAGADIRWETGDSDQVYIKRSDDSTLQLGNIVEVVGTLDALNDINVYDENLTDHLFTAALNGDAQKRLIIYGSGKIEVGNGSLAPGVSGTVSWSRGGPDQWMTYDEVISKRDIITDHAFTAYIDGDSYSRWNVQADGKQVLGSGAATQDAAFWRSGVAEITFENDIITLGSIVATSGGISISGGSNLAFIGGGEIVGSDVINTVQIKADAVDKTKIAADVAGPGLQQEAGGELGINIGMSVQITGGTDLDINAGYIAGNALDPGSGITLNVVADEITLTAGASSIKIKDLGVDTGQLKNDAVTGAKLDETENYQMVDLTLTGKLIGLPYSFRAYSSNTTAIVTNTATKIAFFAEAWDTDSVYDHVTNYRYTPVRWGKYHLSAQIKYHNDDIAAAGESYRIYLYKNGVLLKYSEVFSAAANCVPTLQISTDVQVTSGTDYFEIYTFHTAGSNRRLNTNDDNSWFAGHIIALSSTP